jgi:hypothetical protein
MKPAPAHPCLSVAAPLRPPKLFAACGSCRESAVGA